MCIWTLVTIRLATVWIDSEFRDMCRHLTSNILHTSMKGNYNLVFVFRLLLQLELCWMRFGLWNLEDLCLGEFMLVSSLCMCCSVTDINVLWTLETKQQLFSFIYFITGINPVIQRYLMLNVKITLNRASILVKPTKESKGSGKALLSLFFNK